MIELHWDLDDHLGAETEHSWSPATFEVFRFTEPSIDAGYYACDGKADRKAPTLSEEAERAWRADPSDGLRPLLATRAMI